MLKDFLQCVQPVLALITKCWLDPQAALLTLNTTW
jgi:hypothetical protein